MPRNHRLTGLPALSALADLGFAPIASGVIARRRPVMGLLERVGGDSRAITRMRALRERFGSGPVELAIPGRRILVVLDPEDVGRVLAGAPAPFHPANREKRAALRQFQPHGVLISRGAIREHRRVLNESALDTPAPLHHLATTMSTVVADEATELLADALQQQHLDADLFLVGWWRLVRRIVFGDQARDSEAVTDELWRLRSAGNWSFLSPVHRARRDRFFDQLYRQVEAAPTESLAGSLATIPASAATDPIGQIPHWLFAFDAAGTALSRALALLATHPVHHATALAAAADPARVALRPYLRACILESLRLWPTTPTILRDTTEDTQWGPTEQRFTIEAGAAVMIAVPAFHRDPDMVPFADTFVPEIWLDGRARQYPQLVPFSAGPAECPGRNLVLFVTSTLLAHLLESADFRLLSSPRPDPDRALPLTFDNFGLDFAVEPILSVIR